MNRFEEDRKKNIYYITASVKLFSILFGAIAVFSNMEIKESDWMNFGNTTLITILILFLILQVWSMSIRRTKLKEKLGLSDIIETLFITAVNVAIIIYTGGHTSQYKILFLLWIIASTIQYGMKWGMVIASLVSLCITVIDILSVPSGQVNPYFESDLVLVGVFFITSWLLGYYIKTENFYRKFLSNLANMDELTGLYNHRYFQQELTAQLEIAQSTGKPLALLFSDLDYFKYYNDIYGHQAGDMVLVRVARIMEEAVGDKGIVSRYGGEEFAIILPNTDKDKALEIAEKIRVNIQNADIEGAENQPHGKLTISIGIAVYPENGRSKSELIDNADEALYKAKFISKNKVEVYFSMLDELKEELEGQHLDVISSIKTLISVINAKDRYTYGHTERVVKYSRLLGEALGLPESEMKILQYGAYLHDIGKIEISKELLNKREKLTNEEWEMLKQHPTIGADIIKPIPSLKAVVPLIQNHHERYDGKGYPDKLKGKEIPLLVRILTIADSFDAMTTPRPYQNRKTLDEAVAELRRCAGTQFDGELVETFIRVIETSPDQFALLK